MKITKLLAVLLSVMMVMSCFSLTVGATEAVDEQDVIAVEVENEAEAIAEEESEDGTFAEVKETPEEEELDEEVVLAEAEEVAGEETEAEIELLSEEDYAELLGAEDWWFIRTANLGNINAGKGSGVQLTNKSDPVTGYHYVHLTPTNSSNDTHLDVYTYSPVVNVVDTTVTLKFLIRTNLEIAPSVNFYKAKTSANKDFNGGNGGSVTGDNYNGSEEWYVYTITKSDFDAGCANFAQNHLSLFGGGVKGNAYYTEEYLNDDGTTTKAYIDIAAWGIVKSDGATEEDLTNEAKTVTVVFDPANNGATTSADYVEPYNGYVTFPAENPTWENHTFLGWSTKLGGEVIDTTEVTLSVKNTTYYGVWEMVDNTIEQENAVYVSASALGSDTYNDGRSAKFPFKTLNKAQSFITSDSTIDTVYIVGTAGKSGELGFGRSDKTIYIRGYNGNSDIADVGTGSHFYFKGDLDFDNVTIKMDTSDGRFMAQGHNLTVGSKAKTTNAKLSHYYYSNRGSAGKGTSTSNLMDSVINLNSGSWVRVVGPWTGYTMYGKAVFNIDGTASVSRITLGHGSNSVQKHNGELIINLNGGTLDAFNLETSGNAASTATQNGLRYLTINGGKANTIRLSPAAKDTVTGYTVVEINKGASVTNDIAAGSGDDGEGRIVIFNDSATVKTVNDDTAVVLKVTGANVKADVTVDYANNYTATLNGYTYTVTDAAYNQVTITNAEGTSTTLDLEEDDGIITPEEYTFTSGVNTVAFSRKKYDTVWLDNVNGDDANYGTEDSPVKTLATAYTILDTADGKTCTINFVSDYAEVDGYVYHPSHEGVVVWQGIGETPVKYSKGDSSRIVLSGDTTFRNIAYSNGGEASLGIRNNAFVLEAGSSFGSKRLTIGNYEHANIHGLDASYHLKEGTSVSGVSLVGNYLSGTYTNSGKITFINDGATIGTANDTSASIALAHASSWSDTGDKNGGLDENEVGKFSGTLLVELNSGTLNGAVNLGRSVVTEGLAHFKFNGGTYKGDIVTVGQKNVSNADSSPYMKGVYVFEINGGTFEKPQIALGLSTGTTTMATYVGGEEKVAVGSAYSAPENLTRVIIFNNGMAEGFTVDDPDAIVVNATAGGKAEAVTTEPTSENGYACSLTGIKLTATDGNDIYVDGEKVEATDGVYTLAAEAGKTYNVEFKVVRTYTVTYESANGTTVPDPVTVEENTKITLATMENLDGLVFGGWTIGEETYAGGATYTVTADVTATAIWEAKAVATAIFDANGGAWTDAATTKTVITEIGQVPVAPTENPTMEGFVFNGWTPELVAIAEAGATYTATWVKDFGEKAIYISNEGNDENDGRSYAKPIKTLTRADAIFTENESLDTLVVISYKKNNETGAAVDGFGVADKKIYITGYTAESVFDMRYYKADGETLNDSHLRFDGDVEFNNITVQGSGKDGGFMTQGYKFTYGENVTSVGTQHISPLHYNSQYSNDSEINVNSGSFGRINIAMFSGQTYTGRSVINVNGGSVTGAIYNGHNVKTAGGVYGIVDVNINGGTVAAITLGTSHGTGVTNYAGVRYYTLNDGSVTGDITITCPSKSELYDNGDEDEENNNESVATERSGVTVVEINKAGVLGGVIKLGTNKQLKAVEADDATRVVIFNNGSYVEGKVTDPGAIVINAVGGTIKAATTEPYAQNATTAQIKDWAKKVELIGFAYTTDASYNKAIVTDEDGNVAEIALTEDGILPANMAPGTYTIEFVKDEEDIKPASIEVSVEFNGKSENGTTKLNIAAFDMNGVFADEIEVAGNTGNTASFSFGNLIAGKKYKMVIEKNGYVSGSYEVTPVEGDNNTLTMELIAGDIKGSFEENCGDGLIDIDDFIRVIRAFDKAASQEHKDAVDIDESGTVDIDDVRIIKDNYSKSSADVVITFNGETIATAGN